ncbi:MAG: O-antigen ligase family protein [Verrucomicrobiota bacterium]
MPPSTASWLAPRKSEAKAIRFCDGCTAILICLMVVFAPWAFGTTQTWSIWTMNIAGYALGVILIAKKAVQQQTGYQPPRWDIRSESDDAELFQVSYARPDPWSIALGILTFLVLAYTLVSALNARATYIPWQRRFDYHDCIRWLPHSYDRVSTWNAFWNYLGLACFFWAARDWLLGKSARERMKRPSQSAVAAQEISSKPWFSSREPSVEPAVLATPLPAIDPVSEQDPLPARLRLLLWVLCLNGSLLAFEAILQRLSGTNKLLWLVVPRFNQEAVNQFGPYAYRANAASFFNLIWPVCLGWWIILRRHAVAASRTGHRAGSGSYLILLPGAVLMAACPIISSNRGGALIAGGLIGVSVILLWRMARHESLWFRLGTVSLFGIILAFGAALGWDQLVPRFQTLFTDQMSRRAEIHLNALPIARDFPVFGTGPGTFGSLYHLYRKDVNQDWAAYVHDDWLETRITFGWVGFILILLMLGAVAWRWNIGPGLPVPLEFIVLVGTALGGVLLHAKFDFPFQIYSIHFLAVLLSAVLFCLARPPAT